MGVGEGGVQETVMVEPSFVALSPVGGLAATCGDRRWNIVITNICYIHLTLLLTVHSQCLCVSVPIIAHTTRVVSSVSPSHSQCVGVGSSPHICHSLREVMATVITDHITIQRPGDSCSRTTSGGTGQSEYGRERIKCYCFSKDDAVHYL